MNFGLILGIFWQTWVKSNHLLNKKLSKPSMDIWKSSGERGRACKDKGGGAHNVNKVAVAAMADESFSLSAPPDTEARLRLP